VPAGRRRALGQHFLRDPGVANAIVDLVTPTPADHVVEIGAGDGALTQALAERAGRLTALEIDPVLAARLRARLPGVAVVEADARVWPFGDVERPPGGRVLVVGNLPYSVGKPILAALIAARATIDEMALMLQQEVAERVAAAPGSRVYGALSVLTQLHADVGVVLRVPSGVFRPPPKVDSAVIHARILKAPRVPVADERRFAAVVRAAFGRRRKMLANALASGLGVSPSVARCAAAEAGIDPSRRAETLTIPEFAALAARL